MAYTPEQADLKHKMQSAIEVCKIEEQGRENFGPKKVVFESRRTFSVHNTQIDWHMNKSLVCSLGVLETIDIGYSLFSSSMRVLAS